MWETINKDPLIRAIVVIILGIIGFGLAFNIMFGNSYTSAYTINTLLKIAILGLFIAAAIRLYKYIDKQLAEKSNTDCSKNSRMLIISVLAAVVLIIAMLLPDAFAPRGQAIAYYNAYQMKQGFGTGTSAILAVLAKVLMFISGAGLIIGLTACYKSAAGKKISKVEQKKCSSCGLKLDEEWLCCPKCGADKEKAEIPNEAAVTVSETIIEEEK